MKKIFSMMLLCAAVVFASCSKDEPKADSESTTITWATGNLVADGPNGAKIGEPTDGGLYFQFGSLVGWSAATGDPTIAVKPANYAGMITWSDNWVGDSATENAATGTGDPCKYYLKGTWRLPTNDEYVALFKDNGYPTNGPWTWNSDSKSATHTDGLTFPAAGLLTETYCELKNYGTAGSYWTGQQTPVGNPNTLYFVSNQIHSSTLGKTAYGLSVRCVQENKK